MSGIGTVYYPDPFVVKRSPTFCFAPSRQEESNLPIHPCCYSQDAAVERHTQCIEHVSFYRGSVTLVLKYVHTHLLFCPTAQTVFKFWCISKKLNRIKETPITRAFCFCQILKDRSKHRQGTGVAGVYYRRRENKKKRGRGRQPKYRITTGAFIIPETSRPPSILRCIPFIRSFPLITRPVIFSFLITESYLTEAFSGQSSSTIQ